MTAEPMVEPMVARTPVRTVVPMVALTAVRITALMVAPMVVRTVVRMPGPMGAPTVVPGVAVDGAGPREFREWGAGGAADRAEPGGVRA
ncbi:hypothetical protein [Streptomyces sp. NPDC058045]|uniref:hypothetical protein n=1 Tax=Streptomyces sp. NPDC058045 TaxID=3346311 RepID=UPI0036E2C776